MKTTIILAALLSVSLVLTAGCGCGGGGGDDGIKNSVSNQMSELNQIAVRVNGKYDKLTAEEKKKFQDAYGDEVAVKSMLKQMANPPNKKYQKKD
jgi:hypothetical protein